MRCARELHLASSCAVIYANSTLRSPNVNGEKKSRFTIAHLRTSRARWAQRITESSTGASRRGEGDCRGCCAVAHDGRSLYWNRAQEIGLNAGQAFITIDFMLAPCWD